ncbi:hypothetical protein Hdeb2414_s0025g00664741 [Helianthus debilis subsp. tardiflorus]
MPMEANPNPSIYRPFPLNRYLTRRQWKSDASKGVRLGFLSEEEGDATARNIFDIEPTSLSPAF